MFDDAKYILLDPYFYIIIIVVRFWGNIMIATTSRITFSDKFQHLLARVGLRRDRFRVRPGLYALGNPDKKSTVFVTANYGLSFNKLREALVAPRNSFIE
jgi:CO dehydrogenase/acetyl-CoA synthase gamma subunit (corrinoid Fe-S protein)